MWFRRTLMALLGVTLLSSLALDAASTQEVAIVVANDGSWQGIRGKLTVRQLARIYRRQFLLGRAGQRLYPVNLPPEHPLRIAVSRKLFGRTPVAMARFWSEQYFNGISPPHVVNSQEAMLRFIASTPGAIGYVVACRVDDRVRVLMTLKLPVGKGVNACRKATPVQQGKQ